MVTFDGRCDKEIRKRIALAKNMFSTIKDQVTNTKLSMRTRRSVKCLVRSVLLYGCETWTMRSSDEQRLQAAEMLFWRRMLSVVDGENK